MTRTRPARRLMISGPSTSVTIQRNSAGHRNGDHTAPRQPLPGLSCWVARTRDPRRTDNRGMPFDAVIFDFFATLTPSTPEHVWAEHTARSARLLGVDVAAWRRTLDDSWTERATGALGDLTATFRELARRNGVEPDDETLADACA